MQLDLSYNAKLLYLRPAAKKLGNSNPEDT